jgi:hypothetical protein
MVAAIQGPTEHVIGLLVVDPPSYKGTTSTVHVCLCIKLTVIKYIFCDQNQDVKILL